MTVKADLNITLTPTARAAAQKAGVDLAALITHAQGRANELSILLKQIAAFHPSTGGDSANYTAIQTVLGELT